MSRPLEVNLGFEVGDAFFEESVVVAGAGQAFLESADLLAELSGLAFKLHNERRRNNRALWRAVADWARAHRAAAEVVDPDSRGSDGRPLRCHDTPDGW